MKALLAPKSVMISPNLSFWNPTMSYHSLVFKEETKKDNVGKRHQNLRIFLACSQNIKALVLVRIKTQPDSAKINRTSKQASKQKNPQRFFALHLKRFLTKNYESCFTKSFIFMNWK